MSGRPTHRGIDWQVVEPDEVERTPWRNGRGTTRELLAWPHREEWRVRVSVADIGQDGPFSRYMGAERWFSVLEGAGVALKVGGGTQLLTPDSEPFRFLGSADAHCSLLRGPTIDMNLMALPGAGRMLRVREDYLGVVPARCLVAAYAPHGGTVAVYDEYVLDLAPRTFVWRLLQQEGPIVIEGEDALWMEVRL
ncbi:MAG TPA: HutD family protein [Ramlibacter sp.]|uniref:HutD/Ves family protein n=1 Tax=Ramlibacter sp. TaxID=1917967 RepID=UPI002C85CC28|nr:HutD family protein [Ramlibacter sp.]HVZ44351.1 HutD family protein [Ramlibacter sp.]